jgi:predicted nucleic-acid-binding Zn-ribbon protein
MNESQFRKCPKCSGNMEAGFLSNAPYWRRGRSLFSIGRGERIFAYKCKQCGYAELWGDKEGGKPSMII